MDKLLLLGAEAIAQGAIDGGISGVYAYPGTPSTEITEYVQRSKLAGERGIHRNWSSNEKTAMEAALGMSYAGKRALVCMKHVGLNVAADAFVNSAITGANGGIIVAVADDPSMHSSQNEQDSRYYAKFSMLPTLEPTNQQEAYEMVYHGFEFSEKLGLPLLLRFPTRLSHSRAGVKQLPLKPMNDIKLPDDPRQFVLLPAIARKRYKLLLEKQPELMRYAEESPYNQLIDGEDTSMGIIACGIALNYLLENYPGGKIPYPVLKVGQYPLPRKQVYELAAKTKKLLVLEDGYPFVEEQLNGFFPSEIVVKGRLDGTLPRDGELNPDHVARALGSEAPESFRVPEILANRPPELCKGCGHRDAFDALNEAMQEFGEKRVFSDIGCYTLGALPPFNAINSCVDMGASITMAKGAADAGLAPAVAVVGDSTFSHSGITGLLDAISEKSPVTIIISDNTTTAMTGGQDTTITGSIESICLGAGVGADHLHVIEARRSSHEKLVSIMKQELAYDGVSVIIPRRECIQTAARKKKEAKAASK